MTSLSFDTIIPSFKLLGHFPSQRPWRASYLPVFNSFTHAYEPAIKAAASFQLNWQLQEDIRPIRLWDALPWTVISRRSE
jgi:hypothetical protein